MKRLLVTGASGFLGWNVCNAAQKEWEVIGTINSHPVKISGVEIVQIDLTGLNDLRGLFRRIRPDAVIHTAAAANPDYCEANGSWTRKINVDAVINIAGLCADREIPFVFTSTDLVFDGLNAPYNEEARVSPVNIYGRQKALAEAGVLQAYPSASVCRMPLMFGDTGPVASGFFQSMVKRLMEGRELRLFVDEFRTPLSAKSAARGLFLALEKEVCGLIHLGGAERISRYDFGALLVETLGVHKAGLVRCWQKEVTLPAPRPPDVSLESSKAFALGFKPRSLREELKELLEREMVPDSPGLSHGNPFGV